MKKALFLALSLVSGWIFAQNPDWTIHFDSAGAFSSPQAVELNGDGVKDILVGGGIEGAPSPNGVMAVDGANGALLWRRASRDHIFTTALIENYTGNPDPEVIMGGRGTQLFALDAKTGNLIWEFWPDSLGNGADSGWYNFYSPIGVPDQNGDGWPDLVVTNGGDATASPLDTIRPAGKLLLLSGHDGEILAVDTMPDGKETYHSPLVHRFPGDPALWVLFGSGGETVRGNYWRVKLNDFHQNGLSNAEILISDTSKGFIAVPSLVDLNGDGAEEIIVPALNSSMVALDGQSLQPLWTVTFPETENYVSPVIGQFTGDPTPDVFAIFSKNVWPFYFYYIEVLIDGQNGQVVWQDTVPTYQLASGNALDWDNDGMDELFLIANRDIGSSTISFQNQFTVFDFNDSTFNFYGGPRSGLNVFTSPLVTDLDADSLLEVIYTYQPLNDQWYHFEGFRLERLALPANVQEVVWGGYLGSGRDGYYVGSMASGLVEVAKSPWVIYPNPAGDELWVDGIKGKAEAQIFDLQGRILLKTSVTPNTSMDLSSLPGGLFLLFLKGRNQSQHFQFIHQ